ncbi:MAG: ATP-dependent RNA helicase DbpA [Pseudomonadales bacterium]
MSESSFSSLQLHPSLISNLESLKFDSMTPIQGLTLPPLLEGKDVIGQAKTGSGKTAAFGLCLLQKLKVKEFRVQTLVLCPTRELADQVARELRQLGRAIHNIKILTLYGGTAFGPQVGSLEHGAHIIVGTPGRVEEHLRKKNLDLTNLTSFVLDEADRMLEMGFAPTIDEIIKYLPEERQNILFSATFPSEIQKLSNRIMNNPLNLKIDSTHDSSSIQQVLYEVADLEERNEAIRLLIEEHGATSTLVFCNMRQQTADVAKSLVENGYSAKAINGDLEQRDRESRLVQFANRSLSILVATDVAARGLDIDSIDLVINFYLSRDVEIHTHRIGRTGRAGGSGLACSLYGSKESHKVSELENLMGIDIPRRQLPSRKLLLKKPGYPAMVTLQLDAGKKQKIRPGDILGALTKSGAMPGSAVGKIQISDQSAFIAVSQQEANNALQILSNDKVKGRLFRVRRIR